MKSDESNTPSLSAAVEASPQVNRILLAAGVFAVLSALLGYGGVWNRLFGDPHRQLKSELYRAVDAAQMYYLRGEELGGGGRSFTGLNFAAIGFGDDSLTFRTELGELRFENVRQDSFDAVAVAPDGRTWRAVGLAFDSRPKLTED